MSSKRHSSIVVLVAALFVLAFAGTAAAATQDYYGGVSAATKKQVTKEVYRYWSGNDARRMLCIIGRESGYNPRAVNRGDANGGSHGLAQANGIWARTMGATWNRRYTISGGMEIAYRIWKSSGWRAWSGGSHSC